MCHLPVGTPSWPACLCVLPAQRSGQGWHLHHGESCCATGSRLCHLPPRHPRPTQLEQQRRCQGRGGLVLLCMTQGLKSLLFMSHETIFMIRAVSIAWLSGASSRKHARRVSRQGWTWCCRCLSLRQRMLPALLPARCVHLAPGRWRLVQPSGRGCGWLVTAAFVPWHRDLPVTARARTAVPGWGELPPQPGLHLPLLTPLSPPARRSCAVSPRGRPRR